MGRGDRLIGKLWLRAVFGGWRAVDRQVVAQSGLEGVDLLIGKLWLRAVWGC